MRQRTAILVAAAFAAGLAAAAPARANGIVVEGPDGASARGATSPVVLVSHRVNAALHDRMAAVEVEQVFRNRSSEALEGVYLFPLPEGAVVHRFAMTMGGRLVEGEVVPAAEARALYESIVRRRRDPGLLEYAGRGLYRARVFPIPARGEVRVRLSFQQVLSEDAGTLEFRYPLASDRLNGEPVEEVAVDVRVESLADVKAVYSPSHAVEVSRAGERTATVRWSRSQAAMDRDFLLYVGRSPQDVGFSLVSRKAPGEDGTFLAVLAPRVEPTGEPVPRDVVFVLDTSGSMEGEKIVAARRAVLTGIGLLRPGDRFDVIAFATTVVPFHGGLVPADDAHRAAARTWIEERRAVGGTYLEAALLQALSARSEGRLLHVVFVTDGLPTVGERNTDAIVGRAARSNPSRARVFTFGVGSDLDVNLLDRVAEATGGARDYVTGGEELEIAAGRFYAKVERPVMTDVQVDLGPGAYDVYPSRVPDLFAGGQVVLFGRYREAGPRRIRLTGSVGGRTIAMEHAGTLVAEGGPESIARLWAQRKVAFLLDQIRLHGEDRELVEEVERLGTRFAIVSPYTSGLVVEEGELAAGAGSPPSGSPRAIGGSRARWRGPSGAVPPGLREPSDPTPPPPPPTTPPPTTPTDPTTPNPFPAATGPATPTTPSLPPPARSKELRRRKEAVSAEDLPADASTARTIGTRTFVRRIDGVWVDTAWDGKVRPKQVEAWTDAYFALLRRGDEMARILALGERVIFVADGRVYEIVPASRVAPPSK